jgi:hypothetical protein
MRQETYDHNQAFTLPIFNTEDLTGSQGTVKQVRLVQSQERQQLIIYYM